MLGRKLIGLRRANDITSDVDDGSAHAGVQLRKSITRFRIQAGLDMSSGSGANKGFSVGD